MALLQLYEYFPFIEKISRNKENPDIHQRIYHADKFWSASHRSKEIEKMVIQAASTQFDPIKEDCKYIGQDIDGYGI